MTFKLTNSLILALLTLSLTFAETRHQPKPPRPEHAFQYRFPDGLKQTPDSLKRLDQWFMDAKFGAFIHFGVYSILEGEYEGRGSQHRYSEWVQFSGKMSAEEYHGVAKTFNPTEFNAQEWAQTFKACGMKYVVITAKHHDGFALYDSDASDYNIVDYTPFKRDLIKELCEACHAEGLKFGVYYSHAQDWDEPDAPYLNSRSKLHNFHPDLPEDYKKDFNSYLKSKSIKQVEELVTQYPLDLIWYDTPVDMTAERAQPFSDMVRKHLPDCLINSRIIHRGKGVQLQEHLSLFDYTSIGDKEIPDRKLPLYVESPDSVSSSFGYKTKGEHYYHTPEEMIHRFINTVCAGGNSLINNGPMGNGKLDPEAVKIYRVMGEWLQKNGESIYNTRRNPLAAPPSYGNLSVSKDGKSLYLHILQWPEGTLSLEGVSVKASAATFLENGEGVPFTQEAEKLTFTLPEKALNPYNTVIKISLEESLSEK